MQMHLHIICHYYCSKGILGKSSVTVTMVSVDNKLKGGFQPLSFEILSVLLLIIQIPCNLF